MTDNEQAGLRASEPRELSEEREPNEARAPRTGVGLWIGLGAAAFVALAALVTFVLIVALGVINDGLLPDAAASRALLVPRDLANVSGVSISTSGVARVSKNTLREYVHNNAPGDPANVVPSACAANIEGWMAWASFDTPSYPGWTHDIIYAATNIRINSVERYGLNIQESRRFASVSAATAFVAAQRSWYRECAHVTYLDPSSGDDTATYDYSTLQLNLGLDSVIEGSTGRGKYAPPHLVDVYLRNRNIVYLLEVVTTSPPQDGLDRVSLDVVRAAAKKVRALG